MAEDDKKFSKQLIGKTVVSKTGKRFGEVGDVIFETRSGELIHIVLTNITPYTWSTMTFFIVTTNSPLPRHYVHHWLNKARILDLTAVTSALT